MMTTRASILLAMTAACGSSSFPRARFANAPPVTVVNDRLDVPSVPTASSFSPNLYFYDGSFHRIVTRALELPRPQRAQGVNALDEVPDSTWFTNRIGVRDVTLAEIERGPIAGELALPLTVKSTKIGGASFGLIVKDARGVKYVVKFDGKNDPPELETGTDVIIDRILWACGYNVPEDQIAYLLPGDLVPAADAVVKNADGDTVAKLDRATLDDDLANRVHHEPDGRIRVLASRWIEGKTIGGHPSEGVRGDDRNDRIPHELRRDLRGAYSIFAWLDHGDVYQNNFIDTWVEDPADAHHHYVRHFTIDFGKSMGGMAVIDHDWRRGYVYVFDLADTLVQLATGGVLPRPWDERDAPAIRGVSTMFEADLFDPGDWVPQTPAYVPFLTADRFDKFWGATIVARFRRDQIEAAVRAAHFTDPRAAQYVTDTLIARQRKTLAYWFARVNPLDAFAIDAGDRLCFDDLAVAGGLAEPATSSYSIARYDVHGRSFGGEVTAAPGAGGRACTAPLALDPRDDGYTIARVETVRADYAGVTYVHLARDPASGAPRVIGIWRP